MGLSFWSRKSGEEEKQTRRSFFRKLLCLKNYKKNGSKVEAVSEPYWSRIEAVSSLKKPYLSRIPAVSCIFFLKKLKKKFWILLGYVSGRIRGVSVSDTGATPTLFPFCRIRASELITRHSL